MWVISSGAGGAGQTLGLSEIAGLGKRIVAAAAQAAEKGAAAAGGRLVNAGRFVPVEWSEPIPIGEAAGTGGLVSGNGKLSVLQLLPALAPPDGGVRISLLAHARGV